MTDDLTRTLREQAETVTDRPLTFGDVRRRARQIRRRQAGAVAGGIALVAAVVLPFALLGGPDADRSDPDPAPSPTEAVDVFADGVPMLYNGVITYPDGPRLSLDLGGAEVRAFSPLGTDRWVLSTWSEDAVAQILVIDQTGQVLGQYDDTDGAFAVSDDRDAVAWMRADGSPMLLTTEANQPEALTRLTVSGPRVVAITGDCASTCEVVGYYDDAAGGLGSSWAVSTTGTVRDLPGAVPQVVDASADGSLLAGIDAYADDDIHVCGGVYDIGVDDFVWHGCEDNTFVFSPDGGLVATMFGEGAGPRSLTIRDAHSGAPVAQLTDAGLITSYAWEDDRHLLAVVAADDGSVSVQRIGLDGAPETVLDGFHAEDPTIDVPIRLPVP
jgi:hypothetical protein